MVLRAVGLLAPDVDERARFVPSAVSSRRRPSVRRASPPHSTLTRLSDSWPPQNHPTPKAARHELGDQADRQHALHDDVGEAERARHLAIGVVVASPGPENASHISRLTARREPGRASPVGRRARSGAPAAARAPCRRPLASPGSSARKLWCVRLRCSQRPSSSVMQHLVDDVVAVALAIAPDDVERVRTVAPSGIGANSSHSCLACRLPIRLGRYQPRSR